jgi:hypothetical protein
MSLKILGAVASGISAVSQIQAGRAQARAQEAQAKQAELLGKQKELQYRQQGVQILRNTRENISTVTARAAAGGLDPYSGTPDSLKMYARSTGAEESYLARENGQLAMITGDINAQQYRSAAAQSRRQGFMNAIGTVATSAFQMQAIGGPSGNVAASSAPGFSAAASPSYAFNTQPASQLSLLR